MFANAGAGVSGFGVACGAASGGLLIIDADHGKGGARSIEALADKVTLPREAPEVITPGGCHVYLRMPAGKPTPRRAIGILPGLDILGEGGYAICPPSLHPSGDRYAWADDAFDMGAIPAAPEPPEPPRTPAEPPSPAMPSPDVPP